MMSNICPKCNGSGEVAINAFTGRYVAPGPVPEDTKNLARSTCYECSDFAEVNDTQDEADDTLAEKGEE